MSGEGFCFDIRQFDHKAKLGLYQPAHGDKLGEQNKNSPQLIMYNPSIKNKIILSTSDFGQMKNKSSCLTFVLKYIALHYSIVDVAALCCFD